MNTHRPIKAGTVDVSVYVHIIDDTTGLAKTDVVFNSAGLSLSYRRSGGAAVSITGVTLASADAAHSDGGIIHLFGGTYRVDLPDAACAAGAKDLLVGGVVTGGQIIPTIVPLDIIDLAATVTSIPEFGIIDIGTAQATSANTMQLRSALALSDDNIRGSIIYDIGTAQSAVVIGFVGSTDTITISPSWLNTPTPGPYILFSGPRAPTDLSALPSTNLAALNGSAQDAQDLADFAASGYDPSTNKVQGVVLVDTTTTLTGHTAQTGDAFARIGANGAGLSALPWNASWDTEVQSECVDALTAYGAATASALTQVATDVDTIAAVVTDINTTTDNMATAMEADGGVYRFTTNALEMAPTGGGDSAWTPDLVTAASSVLGLPGTGTTPTDPTAGILDTIRDLVTVVDAVVDTILSDTNDIQSRLPAALVSGRMDASIGATQSNAINAAGLAADVTTELQAGLATAAALDIVDNLLDTEMPALTVAVAAVKAKTDSLTFTVAGRVDSNMMSANSSDLTGNGTTTPISAV